MLIDVYSWLFFSADEQTVTANVYFTASCTTTTDSHNTEFKSRPYV